MHEENVQALKVAYRHPFEYISPKLYKRSYNTQATTLTAADLYVENEDEFNSQLGESPMIDTRPSYDLLHKNTRTLSK